MTVKAGKKVKSDMSTGDGKLYSPGRAFLSGLVAGSVLVLVVILTIFILGRGESILGLYILWFMTPLGATVAAGTAAFRQGATRGRIISLAFIVLFVGIFVSGLLDYVVLWTVALPQTSPDQVAGFADVLWRRHLIVPFITILVGALLGMMFGKGVTRSHY